MFSRPEALSDEALADALAVGWDLAVDSVEYLPVGFGSHHWSLRTTDGDRRFVTVDDLEAKRHAADEPFAVVRDRLDAALHTARRLKDCGLDFVVAPTPTARDGVLWPIDERLAAALYPHIEGQTHSYGQYESDAHRRQVLGLLIALHRTGTDEVPEAGHDDFAVPNRSELRQAVEETGRSWDTGPYGERARRLLLQHAENVETLLLRYDQLVAMANDNPDHVAITHGEPHAANTITTSTGPMLIDWDTALIAPPERDLWMVVDGNEALMVEYASRSGQPVFGPMLDLYRMLWDLCEIAGYIAFFRSTHADTRDAAESWKNLNDYIDITKRWPSDI